MDLGIRSWASFADARSTEVRTLPKTMREYSVFPADDETILEYMPAAGCNALLPWCYQYTMITRIATINGVLSVVIRESHLHFLHTNCLLVLAQPGISTPQALAEFPPLIRV